MLSGRENMRVAEGFWTPERIEVLTVNWLAGATPARLVKLLGANSRNVVIGKIHRLGLSGKGGRLILKKKEEAPYMPLPPRAHANYKIEAAKPKKFVAPNEDARAKQAAFTVMAETGSILKRFHSAEPNVHFANLKDNECHWPHVRGTDVTTHFCGAAVAPGSRYCDAHLKIALSSKGYLNHLARRQEMERFRNSNSAAQAGAGQGSAMETHAHT